MNVPGNHPDIRLKGLAAEEHWRRYSPVRELCSWHMMDLSHRTGQISTIDRSTYAGRKTDTER